MELSKQDSQQAMAQQPVKKTVPSKSMDTTCTKCPNSISPKSFYILVIFVCLCISACTIVSAYFDYKLNVAEMESRIETERAYADYLLKLSSTLHTVIEN